MMAAQETEIEAELQRLGKAAPRLTPKDIDDLIVREGYVQIEGSTVTVCALFLKNGFVSVGHSAAASPENFDEKIGRKIARENAREKLWQLEGYALCSRLAAGGR